jgi:hypothetical protein
MPPVVLPFAVVHGTSCKRHLALAVPHVVFPVAIKVVPVLKLEIPATIPQHNPHLSEGVALVWALVWFLAMHQQQGLDHFPQYRVVVQMAVAVY